MGPGVLGEVVPASLGDHRVAPPRDAQGFWNKHPVGIQGLEEMPEGPGVACPSEEVPGGWSHHVHKDAQGGQAVDSFTPSVRGRVLLVGTVSCWRTGRGGDVPVLWAARGPQPPPSLCPMSLRRCPTKAAEKGHRHVENAEGQGRTCFNSSKHRCVCRVQR